MKFDLPDNVTSEKLVEIEIPAYLTNPGEWSVIYNAVQMAANGLRGTAAKQIIGAITRIRKEAMEDALQSKVEAYIIGHNDGWGEAQEVEEANNALPRENRVKELRRPPEEGPFRSETPIADSIRRWSDRSAGSKAAFREGVAQSIDLALKVDSDPRFRSEPVSEIAREVIGGPQD